MNCVRWFEFYLLLVVQTTLCQLCNISSMSYDSG